MRAPRRPEKPRLAVAVDFGTTLTKATILILHPDNEPQMIDVRNYPGDTAGDSMVPSVLSYSAYGEGSSRMCFGYEAQQELCSGDPQRVIYGRFKPEFPSGSVRPINADGPTRNVDELYLRMAQIMYHHIRYFYRTAVRNDYDMPLPDWEEIPVEFCFSVPATGSPELAGEKLKQLARQAGFGGVPGHSIFHVVLTEGEASAIFSLTSRDGTGETVVVVDVGGATSDLCVLNVTDQNAAQVALDFAEPVRGQSIGAINVNNELEQRLAQFLTARVDNPVSLARSIVNNFKLEVEKIAVCSQTSKGNGVKIKIRVTAAPEGGNQSGSGSDPATAGLSIAGNQLTIGSDLIQRLVDAQVLGTGGYGDVYLKRQLDAVIEDAWIKRTAGTSGEVHLILWSGGFGSSAYVRGQLQRRLIEERDGEPRPYGPPVHRNIKDLKFAVSSEPQMCVCKGLLQHWLKDWESSPLEQEGQAEDAQGQKKRKGSWWRRMFRLHKK
ncbi:hypothetical protein GGTG_02079 [Gaeumannomyces tritici R3-111a-1]|uniref:Uncharacterized protein n=1 Tax=Gaeumannomyces tritici (strain R3-111a-1) TaxID=644352 RepID=J3NLD1_GAET3|nr:hypothetical protein GGTG_02079 [Gaeumannomyces tritici R3-111a-1]EJT82105.1 hypothetical protein GGTG_02079 [Gaeumannomyces tritici R3-111a-1]